jgi:hypothetical protein
MQKLVDFLIEERYCNSELEAVKILESVSDSFYEYLIEGAGEDELSRLRLQLRNIERRGFDPTNSKQIQQIKDLRTRITNLKVDTGIDRARQDIEGNTPKGRAKTPRGPGGRSAQKEKDVISQAGSLPGVSKRSNSNLTGKADKLLGQKDGGEVPRAGGSSQRTRERVQRMYDPNVSGGRGTGTTRTGGKTPSSNG